MNADELTRWAHLLQHGDSQFPSGAFACSAGLEGLLADGMIARDALADTIGSMLHARWAPFDRVVVRRAWRAQAELATLAALDAMVEASLLAPAERIASTRAGAALLTTHLHLGTPSATVLRGAIDAGALAGHRSVLEGALWRALSFDEYQAALLSGYGFASTLLTACVRLGQLGAMAQQHALAALLPAIAAAAAAPLDDDALPCAFNPLAEIAMMRRPLRATALFAT